MAFLDHDDVLRPHALFEVVARIHQKPDADVIYSDEDLLLPDGRRGSVFFKPNWSPAWLLGQNYITHLMVVRRQLLREIGGFRTGYDGSQDHDLLLRVTERTDHVEHIADVLYSWRQVPGSTALSGDEKPLARLAGRQCVEDALGRRGTPGRVELGPTAGIYDYRYDLVAQPSVSVLIPTRDRVDLLERCLESVAAQTTYPNAEIVILDNDSRKPDTHEYLARCGHRVVATPGPFNYSRIVNLGVRATSTPYALLLNNDTIVLTDEWIERLLELCQLPDVGVVGCQLRHRDGRLQHTGIGIGFGHIAYNLGLEYGSVRDASAVTGACMMVKREAFDLVDGFDEAMGIAYGDVDFCLRVPRAWPAGPVHPLRAARSRGELQPGTPRPSRRPRRLPGPVGRRGDAPGSVPEPQRQLARTRPDSESPAPRHPRHALAARGGTRGRGEGRHLRPSPRRHGRERAGGLEAAGGDTQAGDQRKGQRREQGQQCLHHQVTYHGRRGAGLQQFSAGGAGRVVCHHRRRQPSGSGG